VPKKAFKRSARGKRRTQVIVNTLAGWGGGGGQKHERHPGGKRHPIKSDRGGRVAETGSGTRPKKQRWEKEKDRNPEVTKSAPGSLPCKKKTRARRGKKKKQGQWRGSRKRVLRGKRGERRPLPVRISSGKPGDGVDRAGGSHKSQFPGMGLTVMAGGGG